MSADENSSGGLPSSTSDHAEEEKKLPVEASSLAGEKETSASSGGHDAARDLYGLKGILSLVHMSNVNMNALALGTDLTTLGLNLNSPEPLFASFASPLLEEQPPKEAIEFFLPPCYYMNPPTLKMSHLQKFTAETLFYMFYTIVCDSLQGYAAAELYNRGWLYHSEWRKWFTTGALQQQQHSSQGADEDNVLRVEDRWTYFEPAVWEKRTYHGTIDPANFLKAESLRDLLNEQQQYSHFDGRAVSTQPTAAAAPPSSHQQLPLQHAEAAASTVPAAAAAPPTANHDPVDLQEFNPDTQFSRNFVLPHHLSVAAAANGGMSVEALRNTIDAIVARGLQQQQDPTLPSPQL